MKFKRAQQTFITKQHSLILISSSLTDVKQANKCNYPPISVIHSVRASEILNKIKLSQFVFSSHTVHLHFTAYRKHK